MDPEDIYTELLILISEVDSLGSSSIKKAQQLKQGIAPKSVFKYRTGIYVEGKCWDIENLINNQIRLSFPKDFNDPYDSLFSIAINTNNDIEEQLLNKFIYEPAGRSMKICCFSEAIESMLMWTHYANEHKGFAIEYRPNQQTSIALQLWPVFYREKLFDISKHLSKIKSNLIPILPALHKAIDWKYEREWRLILPCTEHDSIAMPIPKAIYIGSKAGPTLKNDLTKIAKEKSIQLYQMDHDIKAFKMKMTLLT